jgi:hypothetical protein
MKKHKQLHNRDVDKEGERPWRDAEEGRPGELETHKRALVFLMDK